MTQQLLSSPAPRPRPYRVCNWDRSLRKGVMARNLAELLRQVSCLLVCLSGGCLSTQWGGELVARPRSPPVPWQAQSALLVPDPILLVLDEDGTAVETEAFFQTLEEGTVLMVLGKGQTWAPSKVGAPGVGACLSPLRPSISAGMMRCSLGR